MTATAFAGSILIEGFEYANHDFVKPIGWVCDDDSWLCGYLEKDHNRIPHTGNWYAFSNADDSSSIIPDTTSVLGCSTSGANTVYPCLGSDAPYTSRPI